MTDEGQRGNLGRPYRRALRIGLVIFVLLVAGVALLAWMMGDTLLPMEYEVFN